MVYRYFHTLAYHHAFRCDIHYLVANEYVWLRCGMLVHYNLLTICGLWCVLNPNKLHPQVAYDILTIRCWSKSSRESNSTDVNLAFDEAKSLEMFAKNDVMTPGGPPEHIRGFLACCLRNLHKSNQQKFSWNNERSHFILKFYYIFPGQFRRSCKKLKQNDQNSGIYWMCIGD